MQFISAINQEVQVVNGRQYTDFHSQTEHCKFSDKLKNTIIRVVIFWLIIACGDFKKRKNDSEISLDQDELNNQEEGLCTGVIISDRFALTAAHCLEEGAKR